MKIIIHIILGLFTGVTAMILAHIFLGKYAFIGLIVILALCAAGWVMPDTD